ncbi:MAG: heme-copper oxidase subunit [Bacteroidota bacterium]|jgi:cytochrome c oxidase subunit 3|nr:heme-copper oxidase subunit [Bacteroidota bacterium]
MEEKVKPSPTYKSELKAAQQKASKPLLWVGILSIVMLFAGLTSAYVVRADNGNWLLFELPSAFYLSTAVIVTSSITLFFALQMAKKSNRNGATLGLLATFFLGILFAYLQYVGWGELYSKNIVFAGKTANASGSFLYLITFLHLLHLFAGLIAVLVTLKNSIKGKYHAGNTLGLELCSIYWHFLDILWVYLFLFLYYIR